MGKIKSVVVKNSSLITGMAAIDSYGDDDQLLRRTFKYLDKDQTGFISYSGLKEALAAVEQLKDQSMAALYLEKLILGIEIETKQLSSTCSNPKSINIEKFMEMCSSLPRINEHRLEWVKSHNLNTLLANKLRVGVLWDGLLGIKEMKEADIIDACTEFSNEVMAIVIKKWNDLKFPKNSAHRDQWEQAAHQMRKFRDEPGATSGKYGDNVTFHGGLESQLGAADPYILKGILCEHIHEDDSHSGFMPSNYGIYTTPCIEFARLLGNVVDFEKEFSSDGDAADSLECKGPGSNEIRALQEDLMTLKSKFKMIQNTRNSTFPGEIGDKVSERRDEYIFVLKEVSSDTALKTKKNEFQKFQKSVADYAQKSIFVENEGCLRGINAELWQDSNSTSLIVTLQFKPIDILETKTDIIAYINKLVVENFQLTCDQGLKQTCVMTHCASENNCTYNDGADGSSPGFRLSRRTLSLKQLTQIEMVKKAKLRLEEAVVEYQYTGPLFQKWNSLLRQMPFSDDFKGNRYATTIHTLVSAVVKTSMVTDIPVSRKVYRGLSGMLLDDRWMVGDGRSKGGVEYGFLSTTLNESVAMEYSGARKDRGVVFEMEVGAIDCGADLKSISQYPGEAELLFGPLTHLEAVNTRIKFIGGKPVVVMCIKVNCNLKSPRIEEILFKRKRLFTDILNSLHNEVRFDMKLLQGTATEDIKEAAEDARRSLIKKNDSLRMKEESWYNDENNFLSALQDALKNKAAVLASANVRPVSGNGKETKINVEACLLIGERGRRDLISVLCDLKVPLSSCNENGESMLFKACQNGQVEFVKGMFSYFDDKAEVLRNLLPRIVSLVFFMMMSGLYIIFGVINNQYIASFETEIVSKTNCTGQSPPAVRMLMIVNYLWIAVGVLLILLSAFQLWHRKYLIEFMDARKTIELCDPVGKAVSNVEQQGGLTPLHLCVDLDDEKMVEALLGSARLNWALRLFMKLDSTFIGFLAEYFMTQAKSNHGKKSEGDARWAQLKVARLMLLKPDARGRLPIDCWKASENIRTKLVVAAGGTQSSTPNSFLQVNVVGCE